MTKIAGTAGGGVTTVGVPMAATNAVTMIGGGTKIMIPMRFIDIRGGAIVITGTLTRSAITTIDMAV